MSASISTAPGRYVSIHLKYSGAVPGSVTFGQRQFNEMVRSAFEEVGEEWHASMIQRHFESGAVREYDYQPRSKRYMIRKARGLGHQNPLVWSGELKQMVAAYRVAATATTNKATLRVYLPMANKANWKRSENSPDMREELTRVSPREVPLLAEVHDAAMQRKLNAWKGTVEGTMEKFGVGTIGF